MQTFSTEPVQLKHSDTGRQAADSLGRDALGAVASDNQGFIFLLNSCAYEGGPVLMLGLANFHLFAMLQLLSPILCPVVAL